MKKTYLITFLFSLLNLFSYSQITTNEKPISIQKGLEDITKNTIAQSGSLIDLPIPDMQKVYREDAEREKDSMALPRTSVPIFVSLDMSQCGRWTSLKDGGKLWQLGIRAKDAKAIDFVFDKFWLPDGGKFFIFNPNTKETIGAVTSRYLRGNKAEPGKFSTGIVKGDMVILEYYQSSEISEMPIIRISKVYYTYRILPDPGYSCSYNVNVNCLEGENWQDDKRAVALVYFKFDQGGSWGSGALINNTQNNFAPLFLTANHNLEYHGDLIETKDAIDDPDLSESIFFWNYENPNCDSSMPSYYGDDTTTTGAIVKSNNGFYADFALLELIENPWNLLNYTPYHLGWNRSMGCSSGGVCIHHPKWDYKKISTYSMTPGSLSNIYWGVEWIATTNGHGITEQSSSGAPLINSGHKVIGQLSLGTSGCNNLTGMDKFGKLSTSWTGNGNSDSRRRLKDWLDPLNSNVLYLNGMGGYNIFVDNSNCSHITYRVYVPTDWIVLWSFTSPYSYPSGLLQVNPQTHQCTINNPNNIHLIGTLEAYIYNTYGNRMASRTVDIDTGSGFAGTYSQIDNFNVIPHNIPETSFSDGQTLVVGPKCDVYIRSFCFPGTTITHTGANLSLWEYSNDLGYGVIHLKFPYSSNTQYLTIKAVDNTNCKIYEFYVNAVPYSPIDFDPLLSVSTNGQRLNITLGVKSDETDVEKTYDVSDKNVKWDIVICNALTGKVMYENRVEGWSQEIDTTGWPAGIYIIKAQAGEHFVTQKISIK